MENITKQDENDKIGGSFKESEENTDGNEGEEENTKQEMTCVEEEKGRKVTDESTEREGSGEIVNPGSQNAAPVLNELSSPTPVNNDNTCPAPPPRQRRKSRTNSDKGEGEKKTHEEKHDDEEKSEKKEEEEEEEGETELTGTADMKTRGNPDLSPQNEKENRKMEVEENKDKEENETSTRNEKENKKMEVEENKDKEDNETGTRNEKENKKMVVEENNDKEENETSTRNEKENKKMVVEENKDKEENETGTRNRNKNTETPNKDQDMGSTAGEHEKDAEKDAEKEKKGDDDNSKVGLKKELTLFNCVGLIVGNIIGTGIFVSPRGVLQYTGSVGMSLIVWALSGVMAIIGALCYVELGTMIPRSGGNYTYLYEAYGSLPAFISLWMTVVIAVPGYRAVASLSFANYVLQPFFPNEQSPPDSALRIVGILLIVILTFVNCRRVRWATRVQDVMALTKVFALIVIIVVGLFHLTRGTTHNYDDPMEGTSTDPFFVVTAFYHTLYAYEGWDSLNGVMDELKDPLKNMPRAIAISLTCVIVIYMLTNVAYFAVLPKDLMLASPAVAVTFGNLVLGVVAWTIPIFVACSISGALNGSILATSRLLFVSAARGHFPRLLSFVHVDNNTPIISLIFLALMSMCMFVTSDVRVLINYLAFSSNLIALLCISTFFWFRFKHPDLPRPIKIWIGFPIVYIILAFFLCIMPVIRQPLEVVAAVFVLATGLPVYYFLVHKKEKPPRLVNAMDKVTYVCQLLFKAVPEEPSS